MSLLRFLPPRLLSLAVLAAAMGMLPPAWADDYGDVSQLLRAGRASEALAKADQFLAGKPRDPQMRFLRGVILSETGKVAEAIQTFTRLTEEFPELPEPYNNLAVLYAAQNQFDKARTALEMAIRTNPSYATAHENLGDIYARLASQAYNRALQLDGSNPSLPPKLALVRELFSQPRRAPRSGAPASVAPVTPPATKPAAAPAPAAAPTPAAAPAPAVAAAARPAPSSAPAPASTSAAAPALAPALAPAPATPPQPAAAVPASPAAAQVDRDIEAAVQAWAAAWSRKDVAAYLAAYGKDFDPQGNQSRKDWEEERKARIQGKSSISVKLSDLRISTEGDRAVVKFRQAYSADNLNVTSRKTLQMQKVGNRWLIVRESVGS